ncbi:MAG: hypothetical protein GTO46_08460 [Gemmatimonadetes bacterium]|nr:hypothetical protein [Gemmatimonadota bacterium]NIO31667.1 hypothetical protein [Gemmatimonadota bacterium]
MMPATLAATLQSAAVVPLPAEAPIGGLLWSHVIPALLLAIAAFGTFMLYRHFAKREE